MEGGSGMKLSEIQGSYDVIFSLGAHCQAAYQLRRLGLRGTAGPLDWFISQSMEGVTRLIRNRFAGLMEQPSLEMIHPLQNCYCVKDRVYRIYSYHDFPLSSPPERWDESYPEFAAKLNRRVERLLKIASSSGRILFIRIQATPEEAQQLKAALHTIVKQEFRLLIVNYHDSSRVDTAEQEWHLDGICSVMIPKGEDWRGFDPAWTEILYGIHLNPVVSQSWPNKPKL
jgi:hypothetical protein